MFLFFRKMASNKISVNLSRPKTLKGGSSKNIGERNPPKLMATNISIASNDHKMISYLKYSKEMKLQSRILVCERKRKPKM